MVYLSTSAVLSPCGTWRYQLRRRWAVGSGSGGRLVVVMLNPSKADGKTDDPTIRKVVGFAQRWGYSEILVVNLFAYRATDPKVLKTLSKEQAIGPENDVYIGAALADADGVVVAWGANGGLFDRDDEVLAMIDTMTLAAPSAFRITKKGMPEHPLYVPYDLPPAHYV